MREAGAGIPVEHQGGEHRGQAAIRSSFEGASQWIACGEHHEGAGQTQFGQGAQGMGGGGLAQIDAQTRLGKAEDGVGVCPPRRMHGSYMLATIASANSLVRRRVAPSIRRWKS